MADLKVSDELEPLDEGSKKVEEKKAVGRGQAVLAKMVEENLKLNQEMHKMLKTVKRYMFTQQLMAILKIVFFIVLMSAGFYFLPPLLSRLFEFYKEFLGNIGGLEDVKSQLDAIDIKNIGSLINQK